MIEREFEFMKNYGLWADGWNPDLFKYVTTVGYYSRRHQTDRAIVKGGIFKR